MSDPITTVDDKNVDVFNDVTKAQDEQLEFQQTQHMTAFDTITGPDALVGIDAQGAVVDAKHSAGLAVIEQRQAVPLTGKRLITSKWEYWTFVLFYFNQNGSPIGGPGGSLRQAMISLSFPDGYMNWAGSRQPTNTVLLDISGIMFAIQLVVLFVVGPYADYGNWRPWVLISAEVVTWGAEFGMIGIKEKSQWAIANGIWIVGSLSLNIAQAFYQATFPSLVRDLPKMIRSEQDVMAGLKTPEEHAELDSYEKAKLFNLCNIYGSASAVVWFGIAIGISHAIGYATESALIRAYRVLMAYYTPIIVACTLPFFLVMKWRPGQQVPEGVPLWQVGPRQVWYAAKCAAQLKQCLLYLAAYFFLFEAIGAYISVFVILQNESIHYSPELNSAMGLVSDLSGGSGTVIILLLHKRYKWKIKNILFVSAIFSLTPCLWGAIGTWTDVIGFHHVWEFWLAQVWNLFTAAASSYNVTMISEVAPANKLFMFYALFNTLSKTSGFIGPFITAAIIKRANGNTNAAFWFLVGLGAISLVLLWFIDTDQAKIDCAKFAEREARELYSAEQRAAGKANQLSKGDLEEENAA
ncbi:putative autophagy protein [Naematelia encephala]|uniref:Autophagy-related protein n=1 Tax=Naematelia encephala TaxID=71784 RepID=A0A1Y2AWD5_9TREE|nr:putative autophagy protein [Naematelia encephala]